MTTLRGDLIQAVPLIEGKINVGPGDYEANGVIHCEDDGSITLAGGTVVEFITGDDRGYVGKFTVTSGTFTYE